MNFAHDSLKLRSKVQNEDFCFDIETAQGHFFAVLDFAPHDYANLNATLAGKLETVVGSFASLSKFSADLFLGFLAKEINNFLHHLGEQSSGPEILCSAALCLVGGNRLSYLICGNVRIDITGGRLLSLSGDLPEALGGSNPEAETAADERPANTELDQLGSSKLESPLTDRVQTFHLLNDDVVLIMTHGLEAGFDRRQLPRELVSPGAPEPKLICEALMKASASSRDDRTVVVIAGPYEHDVDPALSDLSKSIAVLEAKVNTLSESAASREVAARRAEHDIKDTSQADQEVALQFDALRSDLTSKAARADLEAFEEKLKTLSDALAGKADSADVLGLKHDVSKLNKVAIAYAASAETTETSESEKQPRGLSIGWAALVLLMALGAGFLGAWLQSRMFRNAPAALTASTDSNQINPSPTPSPTPATLPNQLAANADANNITEITVKPGDSLKKFAERYQVDQEKIKELNPAISRWGAIQSGQKIKVPLAPSTNATPSPVPVDAAAQPTTGTATGTIEIVVAPGDSINRFAQRYNSTPQKLRELNPQVNFAQLRTGQKLIVPAPAGG
jgi:LysM repeat protein